MAGRNRDVGDLIIFTWQYNSFLLSNMRAERQGGLLVFLGGLGLLVLGCDAGNFKVLGSFFVYYYYLGFWRGGCVFFFFAWRGGRGDYIIDFYFLSHSLAGGLAGWAGDSNIGVLV